MRLNPVFLLSATDVEHFPSAAKTYGAPEVAFLGRSNVGKSSLINSLLGSREAKVSSTPGRTRAINFFALHEGAGEKMKARPALIFADLPGYGYAKISKSISAEWPKFIEPYLHQRPTLALCIALVDVNVPPQDSDRQLLEFLSASGREFLLVGTKSDRLSNNQLNTVLRSLGEQYPSARLLAYSAKTDTGREELWKQIRRAAQSSEIDVRSAAL